MGHVAVVIDQLLFFVMDNVSDDLNRKGVEGGRGVSVLIGYHADDLNRGGVGGEGERGGVSVLIGCVVSVLRGCIMVMT